MDGESDNASLSENGIGREVVFVKLFEIIKLFIWLNDFTRVIQRYSDTFSKIH